MYTSTSDEFQAWAPLSRKIFSNLIQVFIPFFFSGTIKLNFRSIQKTCWDETAATETKSQKKPISEWSHENYPRNIFKVVCEKSLNGWVVELTNRNTKTEKKKKKKKKKRGEEERNRRQTKHRVLVTFFSLQKESFCSIQRGWEKIYTMHYFIDVSTIT